MGKKIVLWGARAPPRLANSQGGSALGSILCLGLVSLLNDCLFNGLGFYRGPVAQLGSAPR